MNNLIIDCETTCLKIPEEINGYAMIKSNRLILLGMMNDRGDEVVYNFDTLEPITPIIKSIQHHIDRVDQLVFFNAKFDLHWLRRIGIRYEHKKIYDCQIVHYLTHSQTRFPSLNEVAMEYNLGEKIDVIKNKYWSMNIDTDAIPKKELTDYLIQDLKLTKDIYHLQKLPEDMINLNYLMSLDTMALIEIESNGMKYDTINSLQEGDKLIEENKKLVQEFIDLVGFEKVNIQSGDHLSAILYGGNITIEHKEPIGEYKTGAKKGQVRNKIVKTKYVFPRLVTPPKGSELKKGGFYSTDINTLQSLKGNKKVKRIIELLLEISERNKMINTYLHGIPVMINKYDWDGYVHGQFNQTSAVTGRLSSTKPNLQNIDKSLCYLFTSRY